MLELKVSGFEGINAALSQLKLSQRRAAARRVLKDALEPVAAEARRLAPVAEGHLRDSIVVSTNVTRALRSLRLRDGVTVFAGTANRNGVPREFGSFRTAPEPFLRPAWDSLKMGVLSSITINFGAEIRDAIERAARKSRRK